MDCTFSCLEKVQTMEKCFLMKVLISSSGSVNFSGKTLPCDRSKKNQNQFQIKFFLKKNLTIDNLNRFGLVFSLRWLYHICKE